MFSKEVNLLSISLKLYFYKLKAYSSLVHSLIMVQMIALLFSLGGVSHLSTNNGELSVSVNNYSSNIVIVFSLLWIMFIAVQLITKPYKKMELPLVTNRLSGNLSNVGFLMTACAFGGITSSLVGVLLRVIAYFVVDRSQIVHSGFFLAYADLLLGMFVTILYMFLISALGYFIGVLIQLNGAFAIIIPAVTLGVLRVYTHFAQSVVEFFVFEVSLSMFVLKVIIASIYLFGVSIFLSNRMEVSQ